MKRAAPSANPGLFLKTRFSACTRRVPVALILAAGMGIAPACRFWSVSTKTTEAVERTVPSFEALAQTLDLTREAMSRNAVRKFLNETFSTELTLNAAQAASYGIPIENGKAPRSSFTESHFLRILLGTNGISTQIRAYLDDPDSSIDPETLTDPARKQALQEKRSKWRENFRDLATDQKVVDQITGSNDPFAPLVLIPPDGSPGYTEPQLLANHETWWRGETRPAADLKQVWIDFINGAKKEIVLNVFDFDLQDVADALVARKQAGVSVRVGIDGGVVKNRPEVKAVFDKLDTAGIAVTAVDSVGLNHQKIGARDWSHTDAMVLLSSGNLTQSCIGKEGDLKGVRILRGAEYSIPNANHVVTLRSRGLALVINHELSKTLDLKLRGSQYPQSGLYQFRGKEPGASLTIAFSPRGGYGDLNRDFIAQVIRNTSGPLRMLQFAFSSKIIEAALYDRARREGRQFEFASVGDTPFALRDWSAFLSMSGLRLSKAETGPAYVPVTTSDPTQGVFRWEEVVDMEIFRSRIHVAPEEYGVHRVTIEGKSESVEVTSKIHHKVLLSGGIAIVGTSYNFSAGALSNQEQLVAFKDPVITEASEAMFQGLYRRTKESVAEKAAARNAAGYRAAGDRDDADSESAAAARAKSPEPEE